MSDLPEFDAPPVVEVALGVQFRPLFGLRPIELAGLREQWRLDYPLVQDQPPLPQQIEAPTGGTPQVQFVVGPALQTRIWFLNQAQTELVQLQHDRLTVNWRQATPEAAYPRYRYVRDVFEHRFEELEAFVTKRQLGSLDVTQAEVTYINVIEPEADQLGRLDRVFRNWQPPTSSHLGEPEQARALLVFRVPGTGRNPVRMYVATDPTQRPDGRPAYFFTIAVRGAPTEETLESSLRFMDQSHSHIVRSFTELTPERMHSLWGRRGS